MIEEEAPTDYGKGGYLRINIGDTLGHQGRYVIKRKLGWGVFSTVWLAEDTKEGNHVAIKICRSDRETRETAAAEVHILKETMWHGRAQDNIVRLIDDFYHPAQRPSRLDHACLVFEVLGPNLLTFLEAHIRNVKNQEGGALPGQAGGLPLGLVKEFAKQMLAGTSYLHDFCRHIHTDLKPENIAITLPDIERIVKRDLSTTAPTSTLVETSRPARSGHRQQIVQPQQQPHLAVTADAAPADANSLQRIQIFESQPLPTPIYRLTTPRTSSDDEHCTTTNTNTTSNSAASSFQANESSTGSSSGARTISTCTGSISTTDAIPIEIGTPRDSFTRSNAARPIAIASPSSPIISTFANISRRLSTSINSLSLSSWPFARSPPTREPLAALLRPTLEDDEKEKIKLENSHNSNSTKRKVLPDLGLKIVDFGNAQPVSEVYFGRIQTRQYRAPEVIIGRRDWDRKVDVWSIACIVFELVTGDFLFDPPDESKNRDRDHVYQILELTNPFYDRRWVMGGRQSAKIFTPNGEPEVRLKYRTLRQLLEEKYHLDPFDARGLSDFLLPMLEFEPCNRANAREMVSHPWLDGTKPTRPFPPENLDEFN